MSKFNKNQAPYYDDYDSSKQYTHLLALPGRVAQAREITQLQSVIKDIVKGVGDSIFRDGNVIEGCQVTINSSKTLATVSEGKVYLNGMVLPVAADSVPINGRGTEIIGFQLVESLVTENTDNTLRDPAQGYDNYNQAGCHRIKSEVKIVKDVSDSAILVTLVDGSISVEKYAPSYDTLTQTLARRTYDESGSYIVEGLNVRVEADTEDSNRFNVVVESGKAYVLGYELKIPAPRRISLPRAHTTDNVADYGLSYSSDRSNYVLLDAPYVSSITKVTGYRNHTESLSAPSTNDAKTQLAKSTVFTEDHYSIQGYTANVDYELIREGNVCYIVWKGTDNYPKTSYSLTYRYTHEFDNTVDYELYHNPSTDAHEIHWISGITPIERTTFYVTYEQYLARKDTVYIDQYGEISVVQGEPAQYGFEIVPETPINTLALATVMSPPAGDTSTNMNLKIHVANIGLTRFTMSDIQSLLRRIRTIEYDQAVLSLNDEARQYETTNDKRGIFTDPILDLSKIDYTYNLDNNGNPVVVELPVYDAAIDLISNTCYLPVNTKTYDASYDATKSTSIKHQRTATIATTGENVVLSQMNATKHFLVNPYSQFPQLPEISITPAVDTWIEDSIIEIPVSQSASEIVSTSTRHVEVNDTRGSRRASTTSESSYTSQTGTRVDTFSNESVIEESAVKYIRSRNIEVSGSHFPPNLDNITCYFDGVKCDLTSGDAYKGSVPGTIKADNSGKFEAKFMIPERILTGIREVRLESSSTVPGYESYETSAFALYQASGTSRTIQRTVTTLTTVLLNRVTTITTTNYIDPVGQTFVLDKMTLVRGIDLYFQAKPDDDTPITCDIREVVNGNITSTIYGHKTLLASEVNISEDSNLATRFTFEDPVLLEENKEYAVVVRSTSPSYRIWVAELGGIDVASGDTVVSNPYLIGVMMSSSNNSSWTMHQTTDIKFRLIENTYATSSEVYFDQLTSESTFSRVYLLADAIIPEGTSVSWYYSVDNGITYQSIAPYNISLLKQMYSSVLLKAVLTRNPQSTLSPIIAIDSVGAILSSYDTEGYYISKNIPGLDEYTHVDIILDTYILANTRMKVFVSASKDEQNRDILVEAPLDSSEKPLNYGWREKTYRVTLPEPATTCRIYVKMESDYEYLSPSFRRLRAIMS